MIVSAMENVIKECASAIQDGAERIVLKKLVQEIALEMENVLMEYVYATRTLRENYVMNMR